MSRWARSRLRKVAPLVIWELPLRCRQLPLNLMLFEIGWVFLLATSALTERVKLSFLSVVWLRLRLIYPHCSTAWRSGISRLKFECFLFRKCIATWRRFTVCASALRRNFKRSSQVWKRCNNKWLLSRQDSACWVCSLSAQKRRWTLLWLGQMWCDSLCCFSDSRHPYSVWLRASWVKLLNICLDFASSVFHGKLFLKLQYLALGNRWLSSNQLILVTNWVGKPNTTGSTNISYYLGLLFTNLIGAPKKTTHAQLMTGHNLCQHL